MTFINALVRDRYPYYANTVDGIWSAAIKKTGKGDDSPEVLDIVAERTEYDPEEMWANPDERAVARPLPENATNQDLKLFLREAWNGYIDQARAWWEELLLMPSNKLMALYNDLQQRELARGHAKELENDQLHFFNGFEALQGLEGWSHLSVWTADEAAALSLGRNPDVLNKQQKDYQLLHARSPFLREFAKRVDSVERALAAGEIKAPLTPAATIDWFASKKIQSHFPAQAPSARNIDISIEDAPIKTVRSLMIMCLAMAEQKYNYSFIKRSDAAKRIASDAAEILLEISDDTVGDILKDAFRTLAAFRKASLEHK